MSRISGGLKVAIVFILTMLFAGSFPALAKDIPYKKTVVLRVGQTVILKGVRNRCRTDKAPSWRSLTKLPKLKTGVLMDGGVGTMRSDACKMRVAARAIKFKATKRGVEKALIYSNAFHITVK